MNRQNWKFSYPVEDVLEATKKKIEIHQKKLKWWEDKKAEAIKKVGEGGITVQDSVAASYSNTKGGFGPQVLVEASLQRDLTECQSKIMQHHEHLQEYKAWKQVLKNGNSFDLELDHSDYLFFFGE